MDIVMKFTVRLIVVSCCVTRMFDRGCFGQSHGQSLGKGLLERGYVGAGLAV